MDSFDKIETMLAEIIEQGNEQKKTSAKLSEKMDGIDGRLGNIETASSNPQTSESVITLADHEKRIGAVRATVNKWYNDYAETKKQCDELLAITLDGIVPVKEHVLIVHIGICHGFYPPVFQFRADLPASIISRIWGQYLMTQPVINFSPYMATGTSAV